MIRLVGTPAKMDLFAGSQGPTQFGGVLIGHSGTLRQVKTQLPYDYYDLPFCRPRVINKSRGLRASWFASQLKA